MVRPNFFESRLEGTDSGNNLHGTDSLAFLLIIYLAITARKSGIKIPMILETIAKDSTRYFLVIFSAHLALEMTLNLGRVSATGTLSGLPPKMSNVPQENIQLLPGT